eukprot:tig00021434_g21354.t1
MATAAAPPPIDMVPAAASSQHAAAAPGPTLADMLVDANDVASVTRAIAACFPGSSWTEPSGEVHTEVVSGGITNALYKVRMAQEGALMATVSPGRRLAPAPPTVLVRVFGANTEVLIDRAKELEVLLSLSRRNLIPRVYGAFRNGRLEEYVPYRSLRPEEMADPALAPLIARSLARLHRTDVPLPAGDALWSTIQRWLEIARGCEFVRDDQRAALAAVDLPAVAREVADLRAKLAAVPSPLVFAHCDLLSGNILLHDGTKHMYIIDYEYGMRAPRGFDIGNHFQEYAGFECDYLRYPDREAQYRFFRPYLLEATGREATEAELDQMYTEVTRWGLLAHVYWGVWAVVQARHSAIDFDYLSYAKLRLDEYRRQKALFLSPEL